MRKRMELALRKSGMSASQAKAAINNRPEFFDALAVKTIMNQGSDIQKAAVEDTLDFANQMMTVDDESIDTIQEQIDDAKNAVFDTLQEAGVVQNFYMDLSDEQKEAIKTFKEEGSPEIQEATSLMAARDAKDVPDEMRRQAQDRLSVIMREDPEAAKKATKEYDKLKKKGKEQVNIIGRLGLLQYNKTGRLEGLQEMFREGRKGKGAAAGLYAVETATAKAVRAGWTEEGGKLLAPGEVTSAEAGGIKQQMTSLDKMEKQFAGVGAAGRQLQIAAIQLTDAAKALGGESVAKRFKEFLKEINR